MPGCRDEIPAAFRVKGKEGWAERPGKSKRVPVPGLARSPAGLLSCPSWELRLASLRPCQGQSGIRWAVPAKQQRKQGHRTVPKKGDHHRRSPRIPAMVEQEGGSPPTTRKKAAKVEFQKPARISHTWVPRGSLRRQEQKQARPASRPKAGLSLAGLPGRRCTGRTLQASQPMQESPGRRWACLAEGRPVPLCTTA